MIKDNRDLSHFREDEIKYSIDTVIQRKMYDTIEQQNKDQIWGLLLDVQSSMYEQFGIIEWNNSFRVSWEG